MRCLTSSSRAVGAQSDAIANLITVSTDGLYESLSPYLERAKANMVINECYPPVSEGVEILHRHPDPFFVTHLDVADVEGRMAQVEEHQRNLPL